MSEFGQPATKDDILDLISWLETKPAHETYDANSSRTCMLARYFSHKGRTVGVTLHYIFEGIKGYKIPEPIKIIAYGDDKGRHFGDSPHIMSFGDALKRAKHELKAF